MVTNSPIFGVTNVSVL